MANIELKKVEEQHNRRVLYSVKVSANHMEFPIGILDQGSASGANSNRCRVGWVCIDLAGGYGWRGWS